ncbi:rho GTPase-activating protein 20 [Pristis pectinata]|uniref:rho GTPase-activating protein 20 n=1 Tax=Pristis pectinata TaxID=685728 RepID=UPI00223E148D|nr:rho GTPase-activating protein 20 [Pristis pectinata]
MGLGVVTVRCEAHLKVKQISEIVHNRGRRITPLQTMSPQQDNIGQSRSSSLTGETRISSCRGTEKKKMKSLAQRRQSAPSLVISKALNKTRTLSRESCLSPISPELCPLVRSITGPHRTFLMEGHVQLKTGLQTQDRHLFLFNDVLVIAKSKSVSHFKLKKRVKVSEVWMASYMDGVCEGSTSAERSFVMGWPTTNCVATFSSTEQKEKWLLCFQSCIKEEKEKEHPKSIPLKIITRNVASCVYSKVLTVKNTDTANDVVAMTLQHFGIMGNSKGYQLWVISGKEDTPYPLIGHEYPFSIKMSHIQGATGQTHVSKDAIYPPDIQGPFIIEQLPVEMQCQFILKPSHLAPCQQMADPSQKQCKRKRSIMNWAFWRGSATHLDSMPLSPTSIAPRRLFGLPLSTICENDSFPKPIMDMLSFLFHEGPYTRGIFRRSANAKSCKELKEKLNAGAEVHLASESVFVTAAVFKDFLRNIPGSIFSSDLYNNWMAAMERNSHEEKIKEIQRLLDQLPKLNTLLLHYVFGVLHKIEQQAEENQMNAFNLAVCIAPSILWPPTLCSPETECKSTKKVALFVQFLIENCSRIFGDVFTSLFEALSSRRFGSRDDGPDLPSFQMHDSSYNSLENELNDETDSTLMTKRSQENRSRDSVLSWSDCDLDQTEDEAVHGKVPLTMKPLQIPSASLKGNVICQFSKNVLLDSNHSGYSTCERLTVPRRHRRCSEPNIVPPTSQFVQLCQNHKPVIRKTSCDAVLSQTAENYIEQLQTLQIRGQKLTKQNVKMSTDLGESRNGGHKSDQKGSLSSGQHQPPPPLKINVSSTMSSSSLSSPGTPLSGSSMSSCDSAFSYNAEYFVFTPRETFSTSCFGTQSQKGQLAMLTSPSIFKHFPGQLSPGHYPSTVPASSSTALEKYKRTASVIEDTSTCITGKSDRWRKESGTCMLRKRENGGMLEGKNGSYYEEANGKLPVSVVEGEDMVQNVDESQYVDPPSYREGVGSPLPNTAAKERGLMVEPLQHLFHPDSQELGGISITSGSPLVSTASKAFPGQSGPYQIPQTVFYGQNSLLCFQSKSCQQSSPFMMGRNSSQSASDQHSTEMVTCPSDVCESSGNAEVLKKGGGMAQRKKLSPSTKWELSSRHSEALSRNAAKTVKDYFFQLDAENCLITTQELTNAVIQNKNEWQKQCCTNPKFEDFEHVFFSEESYV